MRISLRQLRYHLLCAVVLALTALSCGRGLPDGGLTPTVSQEETPSPATLDQRPRDRTIGYMTLEVEVTDAEGNSVEIPLSLWYPTAAEPSPFQYRTISQDLRLAVYESSLAQGTPVLKEAAPHPLILFFHGAFTCGTQSLFLTEYLARRGYVVAAPDFPDDLHLCGNQAAPLDSRLEVLRGLRLIRQSDEGEQLDMLARSFRVPGVSYIVDALLQLNDDPDSSLYGTMDEERIGAVGHSFGGETILGLTGAHPDPACRDERIRAAVILSGAVFPFQDRLGEIRLPLMVMQGDAVDDLDLHGIPRRAAYERSQGPAIFLMFLGGVHGSFANGRCPSDLTVRECANTDPIARAINEYTVAFFDMYLRTDPGAEAVLSQSRPVLREHLWREK